MALYPLHSALLLTLALQTLVKGMYYKRNRVPFGTEPRITLSDGDSPLASPQLLLQARVCVPACPRAPPGPGRPPPPVIQ